jgi:hypothetical protein
VKRISVVGAVVLAAASVLAQGKDKQVTGDPKVAPGVSWAGQVVRATGAGAPDMKAANPAQARLGAERAALVDAMRNLLAQVKGVSIDGTRKMGDLMAKDEVRARVEGIVKGYKIVGKRYFSDSGVEVDIEVPLALLADVVDPDATPVVFASKPEAEKTNTGLVIDARGLKVTPALAPRVLDGEGKAVYSIDSLTADARKSTGVAAYVQSLEEAQKSMKAGDKPLVIKASKATGADLQIAPDDAKKLAAMNTAFLSEGKVVIVLN